jgi:hypothetical protein
MAVLLASLRLTAGREHPGSVWYSNVSTPISGTYLRRRVTVVGARALTHMHEHALQPRRRQLEAISVECLPQPLHMHQRGHSSEHLHIFVDSGDYCRWLLFR